jgi:hypothetical protein
LEIKAKKGNLSNRLTFNPERKDTCMKGGNEKKKEETRGDFLQLL